MESVLVRPLSLADAEDALALYVELTTGPRSVNQEDFATVLAHAGTTVYGAELDGSIRSMATLHLLPNVTWSGRPYGLVENVVTAGAFRGQGLGREVMMAILSAARSAGAYKVMLQTGNQRGATGFYRACGFDGGAKTAMQIRWE